MLSKKEKNEDAPCSVEATGLGKRFGDQWAVRGASIRVLRGECVAVLGPNGAGKSTLLKLFATLWRPSAGTLKLFGRSVPEEAGSARGRIGYLGHSSLLYPQLTLRENLLFYAGLYGLARPADRVRELCEQLGLVGWGGRPVRSLSRGLEQRAGLARALLHEPELLLLDEPLSGMDAEAREKVQALLASLRERKATIMMSTHDFSQAEELCERVVCLRAGRVVYDGPTVRPLAAAYRTWMRAPADVF